jgi:hypothetical protein
MYGVAASAYDNKVVNNHHLDDYGKYDSRFDNRKKTPNRFFIGIEDAPYRQPTDIWRGFRQVAEGNCVTVSAIKAAMMRFGDNPHRIYKKIEETAAGFKVTMKDSYELEISEQELKQAIKGSGFQGEGKLLRNANFLYAVSAKRAQLENNDQRGGQGFQVAMDTLNDGERPGRALRRLGLQAYVQPATVQELMDGAIGTLADSLHSVAVIDGYIDLWGAKNRLSQQPRWVSAPMALKLA